MQRVNRGLNPFNGETFLDLYGVTALLSVVLYFVAIRISGHHLYKSEGLCRSATVNHYILSVTAILLVFKQLWYH